MKKLDFQVPFTGFSHLGFHSALAAVHTYLEDCKAPADSPCAKRDAGVCDGCGNCRQGLGSVQEDWYFYFEVLCGRASFSESYDGTRKNECSIAEDFCLELGGYRYDKATDNFPAALRKTIDAGVPAIAFLKPYDGNRCAVLVGYDGDCPLMAAPTGAQQPSERAPAWDEVDHLVLLHGKSEGLRPLVSGLKRMEGALQSLLDERVWDDMRDRFAYWPLGLKDKPLEEQRARFERMKQIGWNFDHCHNVAEVFRHRITPALRDGRLDAFCRIIDAAYDSSHDCQWTLIGLAEGRDWNKRLFQCQEAGFCMLAQWTIDRLKKNDEDVLAAVRGMIGVLEA